MRVSCLGILSLAILASGASAQTYIRCEKTEMAVIADAVEGARNLALVAAASVGDTPEYDRWFGRYTPRNAERVRQTLKSIHEALAASEVEAVCGNLGEQACKDGTYAWVYRSEPFTINLCPNFFAMPGMLEHPATSPEMNGGTREGTIIHEMSHFTVIADTDDICYTRTLCSQMARTAPQDAIVNADSYQYFAEDATYYPRQAPVAHPTGRQLRLPGF